jgi:hypothetical protein
MDNVGVPSVSAVFLRKNSHVKPNMIADDPTLMGRPIEVRTSDSEAQAATSRSRKAGTGFERSYAFAL